MTLNKKAGQLLNRSPFDSELDYIKKLNRRRLLKERWYLEDCGYIHYLYMNGARYLVISESEARGFYQNEIISAHKTKLEATKFWRSLPGKAFAKIVKIDEI
jgi:hypothetical protein